MPHTPSTIHNPSTKHTIVPAQRPGRRGHPPVLPPLWGLGRRRRRRGGHWGGRGGGGRAAAAVRTVCAFLGVGFVCVCVCMFICPPTTPILTTPFLSLFPKISHHNTATTCTWLGSPSTAPAATASTSPRTGEGITATRVATITRARRFMPSAMGRRVWGRLWPMRGRTSQVKN